MTYTIAEPCIDVKDRACVDECPVDCIYEGPRMLYIQPDECVDCGACEPACPVTAIFYEDDVPAEWKQFTPINAEFFDDERQRPRFAGGSRAGGSRRPSTTRSSPAGPRSEQNVPPRVRSGGVGKQPRRGKGRRSVGGAGPALSRLGGQLEHELDRFRVIRCGPRLDHAVGEGAVP